MIRQVRGPAHEPFAVHSFTHARLKHARSHIDLISTLMMAEMKVSLAWAMRRRSSERNRFRRYHRDTFLPRLIEILLLVRFHLFPDLRHPPLLRPYSLIRGDSCSRSHFHSVSRFSLSITALVEVKIRATDTYYPGQKGRMRFAISPSRLDSHDDARRRRGYPSPHCTAHISERPLFPSQGLCGSISVMRAIDLRAVFLIRFPLFPRFNCNT